MYAGVGLDHCGEGPPMSTIERPRAGTMPPLTAGQRLDRATFHALYERMPPGVRAELIGGVVSMPSPVSPEHGKKSGPATAWLIHYERFTPGVETLDNVSTALDDEGEPQPDASLRILPEAGGRTRVEGGLLVGPPELVVEVAKSSRYIDLGPKLKDYERAGVLEYVVFALDPDEVFWHVRRGGKLERVPPGADGLYRSESFPGLWLDPAAFFARDLHGLFAGLDRGLATPEHAAFVARLAGGGTP